MENFFISDADGALIRKSDCVVFRSPYSHTFGTIETGLQARATIRAGAYAWPGGYPLYLFTSDGGALCFDCAKREYFQIAYSIRHEVNDGWRIVGCQINYEDENLCCDHCSKRIPSAYGNDDSEG